jgi:hypothetical protein
MDPSSRPLHSFLTQLLAELRQPTMAERLALADLLRLDARGRLKTESAGDLRKLYDARVTRYQAIDPPDHPNPLRHRLAILLAADLAWWGYLDLTLDSVDTGTEFWGAVRTLADRLSDAGVILLEDPPG